MKRLFLLGALACLAGCEKTEIHLPATAAANPSGVAISRPTTTMSADPSVEEFEGMVELFGRKLKARRQVRLNSNGDYIRHGIAFAWYESGQKAGEMAFKDDLPHGKQHIWHENGRKKLHGEWMNGLAHGTWLEWYENGQKKSEGSFLNGEKHGTWSYWDENGVAAGVAQFDRGQEVSVADHYSRGVTR